MAKFNPNKSPNADMLKSIQKKAVTQANSRPTIDLDLNLIDENPDNAKVFNMEDIERLAETIKNEGFFGVVEVYQKPDGRYELSAGHRRTRAVRSLGWKTVPAVVVEMPAEEAKVRRKLIFSNINNRDMTPMDWARAMEYHKQTIQMENDIDGENSKKKMSVNVVEQVAHDFGYKKANVFRYLKLLSLIPELQELVEKRLVPWSVMQTVAGESKEIQLQIAEEIKTAISLTLSEDGTPEPISKGALQGILRKYETKESKKEEQIEVKVAEAPSVPISVSVPTPEDFGIADEEYEEETDELEKEDETDSLLSNSISSLVTDIETKSSNKIVIDAHLKNLSNSLKQVMKSSYVVEDKEYVRYAIADLEEKLAELKEML